MAPSRFASCDELATRRTFRGRDQTGSYSRCDYWHVVWGCRNRVKTVQRTDHVVIRFAGDSGDGMQLTGDRFTNATAVFGNDLATMPDFPAEIRAPAGTLAGVSAFQIHFADRDIVTPG